MVTWHAYGLDECVTDPSPPRSPTVANLLSPPASREFLDGISPYVGLAHGAGAAFRVEEMNSVTCNGRPGVSNTFASALWVMDAPFSTVTKGVDRVNIHTFEHAANALFDLDRSHGHWQASVHPVYYGLMMSARAAPPGSRLLRISGSQAGVRARPGRPGTVARAERGAADAAPVGAAGRLDRELRPTAAAAPEPT